MSAELYEAREVLVESHNFPLKCGDFMCKTDVLSKSLTFNLPDLGLAPSCNLIESRQSPLKCLEKIFVKVILIG